MFDLNLISWPSAFEVHQGRFARSDRRFARWLEPGRPASGRNAAAACESCGPPSSDSSRSSSEWRTKRSSGASRTASAAGTLGTSAAKAMGKCKQLVSQPMYSRVVWLPFVKKLTFVHRRVSDIANSRRLDDVSHHELLDRLVFGHAAGAVGASHRLHMAAAVLRTSVITSLRSLRGAARSGQR